MSRERTRRGRFICSFSAGLIFFLLIGFIPSEEGFAGSSQRDPSRTAPKQKETAKPTAEDLSRARGLFDLGKYVAALEENQRILSLSAKDGSKDGFRAQALFNMGLIYAHVENPKRDLKKAIQLFKAILKDYPYTSLAGEAKMLAGLLQEEERLAKEIMKYKQQNKELNQVIEKSKQINEELSRTIEKSKQVDIDVEEKKKKSQDEKGSK